MILTALLLLQAAPAPAPAPPPAPWSPRACTDATTGAKSVTASVSARGNNARLSLRCDAQVPIVSVQYVTREPLGAGPDRIVAMSFDGGPAVEFLWEFPGTAAFVRDGPQVTALTIEMAKAKVIKVRTMTIANTAVEATFDGPASDAPVKAVLAACGYTLGQVPIEPEPAAK